MTTKERGILFSAPMVLALLEGRKTQTRRALKTQPIFEPGGPGRVRDAWSWEGGGKRWGWYHTNRLPFGPELLIACPYGRPGDRLWVRETVLRSDYSNSARYAADGKLALVNGAAVPWRWKNSALPSIHLPRPLSRIVLEITEVRLEQLHDISEQDAQAESVQPEFAPVSGHAFGLAFETLWKAINGPESWELNPWVWAVTFQKAVTCTSTCHGVPCAQPGTHKVHQSATGNITWGSGASDAAHAARQERKP